MRRLLTVLLLGGMVFLVSEQSLAQKDWTIMVYMVADNNLDRAAIDDINEMEVVGSSTGMDVVVQLDRGMSSGEWTTTRRYHVAHDSSLSNAIVSPYVDLGEMNMGDPNTLNDFVAWAMNYYPATHYFLIIWNHGQGWLRLPPDGLTESELSGTTPSGTAGEFVRPGGTSSLPSALPSTPFGNTGFKYIGPDETDGDVLFNYEIRNALTSIPKLDIIGFDACVMGMIEVGYELRDRAQYMIASEESEPGDGWAYDEFLSLLWEQPSSTPAFVCSLVVQTYSDYWATTSWPKDEDGQTLSAVDLGDIRTVVGQTDNMVNAIIGGNSWPQVMAALPQAERFLPTHFYDLYDIADLLSVNLTDPTIVSASNSLKSALSDAIIINRREAGHPYAHGLSIFFPQEYVNDYLLYCIGLVDFADSTTWPTFLSYYFNDGSYILDYPEPNDLFTQAGLPLNPELAYPSYVSSLADIDWWLINSGLSETITITLNNPLDADLDIELYASDGVTILDSGVNRGIGVPDTIVYSTSGPGYYYLAVSGHNSFSTSPYQLNLNETGHNRGWFRLSYDDNIPDGGYFSYTNGDVIGASFSLPQYPMALDRVWINFSSIAGGGSGDGSFYLLLYDNYGYVVDPLTIGPLIPPDTGWSYLDLTEIEPLIYTSLFVGVWYDGINTPEVAYDDHPSGRDYYWNFYTQSWSPLDKSLFIRLDVRYPTPTGVLTEPDGGDVPGCFTVAQNYPNPFNTSTVISFETPSPGPVKLEIFNILGQRVFEQQLNAQTPGSHTFRWNGLNHTGAAVPSGIYFYCVSTDAITQSRKMVLLK